MMDFRKITYNHLLFLLFIPVVVTAKILRWTVMKASLADDGIGYHYIKDICEKTSDFLILETSRVDVATHNAIYIYHLFNWFDCRTYSEFEIAITITFNIVLLMLLIDFSLRNRHITKSQFFFLLFFIGVMNVYTFTLSKEPIQMLYFILVYIVLRTNKSANSKWRIIIGIILLIVITTRTYFILMLMFTLIIRYSISTITRMVNNRFWETFICFFLMFGIVYFCFLSVCEVMKPDEFAELIRVRTRESEAVTDMRNILPTTNLVMFVLDYLIMVLRMLFPIELLRFGLKYVIFVIYQVLISWMMLKTLREYSMNTRTKNIAVALYWGFLFCSATFEPDFGSWVRHESVTIPFMLFVLEDKGKRYVDVKKKCNTRTLVYK